MAGPLSVAEAGFFVRKDPYILLIYAENPQLKWKSNGERDGIWTNDLLPFASHRKPLDQLTFDVSNVQLVLFIEHVSH